MDYFIKVMIVDDDCRYTKPLQDRAYLKNIYLKHFTSWEEAKIELQEHSLYYSAIILDALGKINSDDKGENQKHITKALTDLAQLRLNIPHFVLTGYFDKVSVFLYDDVSIFKKNHDEEKLFILIEEKFSSSTKNKVARKFPKELQFAEDYFNNEEIKIFIELYKDDHLSVDVFSDATKLRILNEKTMDILGVHAGAFENIDQLIDFIRESGYDIKDGSRTINIIDFLNSKIDPVPKCIQINIKSIYHTCSALGPHSRKPGTYVPTSFQIEAFKFQLLEIITWVNNYLESKGK